MHPHATSKVSRVSSFEHFVSRHTLMFSVFFFLLALIAFGSRYYSGSGLETCTSSCQTFNATQYDAARAALLQYYTGETVAHTGLLLTLFVGFLTAYQVQKVSRELVAIVFGFAASLSVYVAGRILVWGAMSDIVIRVHPISDVTSFAALHDATANEMVSQYGGVLSYFSRAAAVSLIWVFVCLGCALSFFGYWWMTRKPAAQPK